MLWGGVMPQSEMEQLKCIRKQLHLTMLLHLARFAFCVRSIAESPGWNRHQESTALWKPAMSFSRVRKGESVTSVTELGPDGHISWKTTSQQKRTVPALSNHYVGASPPASRAHGWQTLCWPHHAEVFMVVSAPIDCCNLTQGYLCTLPARAQTLFVTSAHMESPSK